MKRRSLRFGCLLSLAAVGVVYTGCALHAKHGVHWAPSAGVARPAPLFVRTLGNSGPPILLLHGLIGSGRYWGADYDALAVDHRLIVPDLLGFGESPKPESGYSPEAHADALAATLDALGVEEPVVIGAHSLGSLIALAFAARHPGRVRAIVAFGPPLYPNPEAARKGVVRTSPMGGLLSFDTPAARKVCVWFHRHPGFSTALTRLLRPDLPGAVAADSVKHTWESYWESLELVILSARGASWLEAAGVPVELIAGTKDRVVESGYLAELARRMPRLTLTRVAGGRHDLPLTHPELCHAAIRKAAGTRDSSNKSSMSTSPALRCSPARCAEGTWSKRNRIEPSPNAEIRDGPQD